MTSDLLKNYREHVRDKAKETMGAFATYVWLGTAIYLYATTPGVTFLSWSAAAFFAVGMFVAAALFGSAIYYTLHISASMMDRVLPRPTPGQGKVIQVFSFLVGIAWAVVLVLSCRLIFNVIEGI